MSKRGGSDIDFKNKMAWAWTILNRTENSQLWFENLKTAYFRGTFFRLEITIFRSRIFSRNPKSFRDHFSMWQNSDSQRIDASYLFIMERPSEPWLQKQIDEESEFFNDIYQVSNMKIYNATSEGFNSAPGLNFSHAARFLSTSHSHWSGRLVRGFLTRTLIKTLKEFYKPNGIWL